MFSLTISILTRALKPLFTPKSACILLACMFVSWLCFKVYNRGIDAGRGIQLQHSNVIIKDMQLKWDVHLKEDTRLALLADKIRQETQLKMTNLANAKQKEYLDVTKNTNALYDDTISSVRARGTKGSNSTSGTGGDMSNHPTFTIQDGFCSGATLSQRDAEFLTDIAALSDRYASQLNVCYTQYNDVMLAVNTITSHSGQ